MPGHGNGDVAFGEVVDRVRAGSDFPVAGTFEFRGQFAVGNAGEPRNPAEKPPTARPSILRPLIIKDLCSAISRSARYRRGFRPGL